MRLVVRGLRHRALAAVAAAAMLSPGLVAAGISLGGCLALAMSGRGPGLERIPAWL